MFDMNFVMQNSYRDCHVKGLHSVALFEEQGFLTRMFYTDPQHEVYKPSAIHSHKTGIKITILKGELNHLFYYRGYPIGAQCFKEWKYSSRILTGKEGRFESTGKTAVLGHVYNHLLPGSSITLQSEDLHTVYCPAGKKNAWLIEEFTPIYSPSSLCYSNTDLSDWSSEGYYKPFEKVEQIEDILKYVFLSSTLTGRI